MEILVIIIIVIVIALLFSRSDASTKKGNKGEADIAWRLSSIHSAEFRVFNDILLGTAKGSSQIDHVVISKYGVFVIETKNYSGWIHGHEYSEYWTQSIYDKKTKFRNPIKQNWAHIYALKEVLSEFRQVSYLPIIVFTGSAVLKNITSNVPVIYAHQLIDTILAEKRTPNLSIERISQIADRLGEAHLKGERAEYQHVQQIRMQTYIRREKEHSLICPKCGGDLIVRDGRYGRFYGCSNYPNCRYTLNH